VYGPDVPDVTYVVMSYQFPEIVERAARRIRDLSPSGRVVVRHDSRHSDLDPARLGGAVYRPRTTRVLWGHWSLVEAQLTEMRWIREHLDPDWVVFVSGQDFPIRGLGEWEATLTGDLVGDARPVSFEPRWGVGRSRGDHHALRCMYRYARLPSAAGGPALHWVARPFQPAIDVRVLPRGSGLYVGARRSLNGIQPWWGFPSIALSRRATDRVLEAVDGRERVVRHFRRALLPEESFIHTLVGNDPALTVDDQPITYAQFRGHGSHPKDLTVEDLPEAFAAETPFARKFSDMAVVDAAERLTACTSGTR
jgi:hypothetical protein